MAMTVEEVKKAGIDLETAIAKLMQEFETDTGMRTGYIDVMRKRVESRHNNCNCPESVMPYETPMQDIETVNIDIRFEN